MTTQIDVRQFRKALGSFTTGVTVVTTQGADGRDYGLTANSFNSVSMDPPMVLWSLGKTSSSLAVFAATGHFAVHILAADQEAVSNAFSKSGTDKFAGCTLTRGHGGVPLLAGCAARFECRVVHRYEGGDHVIFVGEVMNFDSFGHPPLVFHAGDYGLVMKKREAAPAVSSFGDGWLGFLLARAYYQLLVPVRQSLEAHGFRDIDYCIVTVLSMGEGRTVAELDELVSIAGFRVTQVDVDVLVARGMLSLDEGAAPSERKVRFTQSGRAYAIELLTIAKSVESDAVRKLDFRETQVLKLLLGRVIDATTATLPQQWHRERFWRDEHLWRDPAARDVA